MTIAQPVDLSRQEALLRAVDALGGLAERASNAGIQHAWDVAGLWEARLRSAAEVSPGYLLPSDVAAAVVELIEYVRPMEPQDAIEWIDLLPRNVLELAEPATVAVSLVTTVSARVLDNTQLPDRWGWQAKPQTYGAAA
jgi:hypothetical protein